MVTRLVIPSCCYASLLRFVSVALVGSHVSCVVSNYLVHFLYRRSQLKNPDIHCVLVGYDCASTFPNERSLADSCVSQRTHIL